MKLYVSGSQRTQNCYHIIKDLLNVNDAFLPLSELSIHNCKGCNRCQEEKDGMCALQDDMINVYEKIEDIDTFVLATPIYFNHVSGTMKMFIDRLYPFYETDKCKGKQMYLILTGDATEEENTEIIKQLEEYFVEFSSYFEIEFKEVIYFQNGEYIQPKYLDKIIDLKNRIYENKEIEENE